MKGTKRWWSSYAFMYAIALDTIVAAFWARKRLKKNSRRGSEMVWARVRGSGSGRERVRVQGTDEAAISATMSRTDAWGCGGVPLMDVMTSPGEGDGWGE